MGGAVYVDVGDDATMLLVFALPLSIVVLVGDGAGESLLNDAAGVGGFDVDGFDVFDGLGVFDGFDVANAFNGAVRLIGFGVFGVFVGEVNGFDVFACPVVPPTGTTRFLGNYERCDPSHGSESSDLPYEVAHARHRSAYRVVVVVVALVLHSLLPIRLVKDPWHRCSTMMLRLSL
jgi:hypothetical protein